MDFLQASFLSETRPHYVALSSLELIGIRLMARSEICLFLSDGINGPWEDLILSVVRHPKQEFPIGVLF